MSSKWLSLESALIQALDATKPVTEHESVPLSHALGRITAINISATEDVPPWDNSAMDGFAIRTCDLHDFSALTIQGTVTAGMTPSETLKQGHAIRIMTGAPVPRGADAVVMVENTSVSDSSVAINAFPGKGENIRQKACDMQVGQSLIAKGTRLTPQHLMLLSSQGCSHISVFRKIRVGVVATGSELAEPGTERRPSQIFESNRIGVSTILAEYGVDIVDFGIVEDDKLALKTLFQNVQNACPGVDVLVSSGGVSVGDADYVKDVVNSLGKINFWKVAIKPGKPFALGGLGEGLVHTLFCGLPGNPVSAFVTAKLLVTPLIRKLQGEHTISRPLTVNATLTCDVNRRSGRRDFQRATMHYDENFNLYVTPFRNQSSGVMTSITSANCLMVVDEKLSSIKAGASLPIMPFDLLAPSTEHHVE